MADTEFKRRLPAVEKPISDIMDKDVRVRITGTVIGLGDGSLIIDDGTGKVEVGFTDVNMIAGLTEGQMIRIISRIRPLIDGYACEGEAVQNLVGFDVNLYKKAREIISRWKYV